MAPSYVGRANELGITALAKQALELILGADALRAAVDYYISSAPGYELTRSVLWDLRPASAIEYCYQVYRIADDLQIRRSAIELLRVIADRQALSWAVELLRDGDTEIQAWGARMVEQLIWCRLVAADECIDLFGVMASHPNVAVRECQMFIQQYLRDRAELPPEDVG